MQQGTALHRAGQPERALLQFEQALAAAPGDADAASACATLLLELQRPLAAWRALAAVRDTLLQTADGCTNLAITAEVCGCIDEALAGYEAALRLEPDHLRALNNLGLLHARAGRWEAGLVHARRALALQPGDPVRWSQACDMLTGARRHADALRLLADGLKALPDHLALRVRQAVLLAFDGQTAAAQAMFEALETLDSPDRGHIAASPAAAGPSNPPSATPDAPAALRQFIASAAPLPPPDRAAATAAPLRPDARALFVHQALAIGAGAPSGADGHRRPPADVAAALRQLMAPGAAPVDGRYWLAWAPHVGAIGLGDDDQRHIQRLATGHLVQSLAGARGHQPFRHRPRAPDEPLHIGLLLPGLTDDAQLASLAQRLARHDPARITFHIYACGRRPDLRPSPELQALMHAVAAGGGLVELAHMDDAEATARIRLDRLDLLIDTAPGAHWSRPTLLARRAAPAQLREHIWLRGIAGLGLVDVEPEAADTATPQRTEDTWTRLAQRAPPPG